MKEPTPHSSSPNSNLSLRRSGRSPFVVFAASTSTPVAVAPGSALVCPVPPHAGWLRSVFTEVASVR